MDEIISSSNKRGTQISSTGKWIAGITGNIEI